MSEAAVVESARKLYAARSYLELADLLDPLAREELEAQPQLGFWLADARRRLGRTQPALELVLALAAACKRSGAARLELDRLNLEGTLRFETGDIQGAETSWRELLSSASRSAHDEFIARANNNLGIIYTLQVRAVEAITCYERAIAAYRGLGLRRGIAQSSQNLAITYRELGFPEDADKHFAAALRYAGEDGSVDEVARAEQERALLIYVYRNDARLARATLERAAQRFNSIGDPLGVADTQRVQAIIELGERNLDRSDQLAGAALERARKSGHRLLEAEVLEVLGAVAATRGQAAAAEKTRAEAHRIFVEVQAAAWGVAFRKRLSALAPARP